MAGEFFLPINFRFVKCLSFVVLFSLLSCVKKIERINPTDPLNTLPSRKMFITSFKVTGEIKSSVTGVAAGDQLCTETASTAGLSGSWLAYLSDSITHASDRVPFNVNITLLDGTLLWPAIADQKGMEFKGPDVPISMDENMNSVAKFEPVWTGTVPTGERGVHCNDWSTVSPVPSADVGQVNDGQQWVSNGWFNCDNMAHVYCYEKD